jgi:hypothetical protein
MGSNEGGLETVDIIGILVCNSQQVLDHKKNDGKKSEQKYCYWEMSRFPKVFSDLLPEVFRPTRRDEPCKALQTGWIYDFNDILLPDDLEVRLYFAIDGWVKGYFVCRAIGIAAHSKASELRFFSESWTSIKPIPIKPSQGFRYFKEA